MGPGPLVPGRGQVQVRSGVRSEVREVGGTAGQAGLRRTWPWVCAVVAAVLQVGFVVELLLPGGPDVTRSQISELSAPGQPGELWFRAADVVSGLLVLAVVPGWWRASRAVATSLAVWGVGLAVAAIWSASCADSIDKGCEGNGLPGPSASLRDNLHDIGSIFSVFGLLIAILLAGVVLRRHGRRSRGTRVLWLGVVCCALGLFESGEDVLGVSAGRGISQRLQVVLLSVTLVLLASPRRWPRAGRWPGTEEAPGRSGLSPRRASSPSGS